MLNLHHKEKQVKKRLIASCLAVVLLAGCASLASILGAVAKWAPVAQSIFGSLISIGSPAAAAADKTDAAAVVLALTDAASDAKAAQAAGGTGAAKVVTDLSAFGSGLAKVGADLAPLMPANVQSYFTDGAAVLNVASTAFQAALGGTTTTKLIRGTCAGYQEYGDGSFVVWGNCDASEPINYASGGQAAKANPTASSGKAKAPKLGDFKRQWNAVCVKHGWPQNQQKITMLEKLHIN